jgi:signal transduction histidine kinase
MIYDQLENNDTNSQLPLLLGDKTRLQQVLINLVKNALKFTANGNIEIWVHYDDLSSLLHV